MKLTEILGRDRPSISFEVFPPKANTAFESVQRAAEQIAALHPAFMSGDLRRRRRHERLHARDCAQHPRALRRGDGRAPDVRLLHAGNRARAHRGHARGGRGERAGPARRPAGGAGRGRTAAPGPNRYATDLIGDLRASGYGFCIGAACYPEVHPGDARTSARTFRRLKEKVDAGCSFLTTQMFFDNGLLYNFLYKIREAGITVPVIAGIMPITSATQIERAIRLSGSHMPRRFHQPCGPLRRRRGHHEAGGHRLCDPRRSSTCSPTAVNNVHVYSMNRPDVARSIRDNLSAIPRRMSAELFLPWRAADAALCAAAGGQARDLALCRLPRRGGRAARGAAGGIVLAEALPALGLPRVRVRLSRRPRIGRAGAGALPRCAPKALQRTWPAAAACCCLRRRSAWNSTG